MITSTKGLALIKEFEGLELKAYLCPAGVLTIGYGHTGKDVTENMIISETGADLLLKKDIWKFEHELTQQLAKKEVKLNQNQFDALISFSFNVGTSNLFNVSTLWKKVVINKNDPNISREFLKWNKAKVNGVLTELPGLTKRRQAESNLYFS